MNERLNTWLDRLGAIGAVETDLPAERLRKSILIFIAVILGIVVLTIWVVFYWLIDLRFAAGIPFIFQLFTILGLLVLHRTKDFDTFRVVEVLMALTLPVFLQLILGGFAASGAIVLWGAWAPIGELIFHGTRAATPWAVAYLGSLVLAAILDPYFAGQAPPMPSDITTTFFVLNITAVIGSMYFALRYFINERDGIASALAREHELLRIEQQRSDSLLLNILPRPIAERLKQDPSAIADRLEDATVLFADIVDFTRIFGGMAPEALVRWLNELFSAFDLLADQYGLEKIKTIGDAYMVVGGVPTPHPDHVGASAEMALAMQQDVAGRFSPNGERVQLRIGIHTGPVVAGVIGARKFSYDLWGDTVNIASRMESHGIAGAIQVSAATHQRLWDRYSFSPPRIVDAKGTGEVPAYLLLT